MASRKVPHSSHWGAFDAVVENGRVSGVVPFLRDPRPTPIIDSIPDAVHSPVRIEQPTVRKGWLENGPGGARDKRGADSFVPVSWDEALDLVAGELTRVRDGFGNESIFAGSYGWSSAGRFHHAKTQLQRFMNQFGGFTGQLHNYSYAAALALLPHIIGTTTAVAGPVTSWDAIEKNVRLVVAFGGMSPKNTQVESGGNGEHNAFEWMRRCRDAGTEFINIGPIRGDMLEDLSATWITVRPNTDTAVMLAMAYVLETEGLAALEFLEKYCVGYPRIRSYLLGQEDGVAKTPQWAADISGMDADAIAGLARRMAAERTLVASAWSLQRGDHGEQPYWMTVVLAAMLGYIGLPGGGFGFGYGSVSGMGNPRQKIPSPALPTGPNPCDTWIPVARISDLLLNPGASYDFNGEERTYPDIRLVYWCGGNPFHHHQDLNRLVEAFQKPETIIFHEPWWTSAARHADIVLPATTTLERNDIGAGSRDRFVMAMHGAVEPVGQARNDHDIFAGLADRLGFADRFTEGRNEMEWLRHMFDVWRQLASRHGVETPSFDEFWKAGYAEVPAPKEPYTMFSDFRADPEAHALATPSGKIELFSERIAGFGYDDCPGHPVWLEPSEWLGSELTSRFPIHLMSNQPRTRLHSQLDNGRVSRDSKVKGREPLWMHPDDARARGLSEGDIVRVFNDRGEVLAGLVITDLVMPGVAQLATGAWYQAATGGRRSLDVHGNPNTLTPDKGTSRLGQGPSAHSTLVEIERFEGEAPAVTVLTDPPPVEARRAS